MHPTSIIIGPARAAAPLPPSLGDHALLVFLLQIGLLLAAALLLGLLAARLGLPAVVGELTAGVLLGPSVLGHAAPGFCAWLLPRSAEQSHIFDGVGQIGVILLVGVTGMEIDLSLLRRRGDVVVRVGLAGLLVPLALGVAAGFLAPGALVGAGAHRPLFALFIGVAMAVSALPVIARTLADMRLIHRDIGQLIIGVAVLDDVIGWLLLSAVAAAASGGHGGTVGLRVAGLAAVLLAVATVLRPLTRMALSAAARRSGDGAVVAVAVLIVVLGAALTQSMGLEATLGAFLAGLLVGSEADAALLRRLAPLHTVTMAVFAPLFFVTAGLRADATALGRPAILAAAVAALLVAVIGKFSGAFAGAFACRLTRWEGLALASGTNARGAIQIVVATVGLRIGVISASGYTVIILIAIATSAMVGPVLRRAVAHIDDSEAERARQRMLDVLQGVVAGEDLVGGFAERSAVGGRVDG